MTIITCQFINLLNFVSYGFSNRVMRIAQKFLIGAMQCPKVFLVAVVQR